MSFLFHQPFYTHLWSLGKAIFPPLPLNLAAKFKSGLERVKVLFWRGSCWTVGAVSGSQRCSDLCLNTEMSVRAPFAGDVAASEWPGARAHSNAVYGPCTPWHPQPAHFRLQVYFCCAGKKRCGIMHCESVHYNPLLSVGWLTDVVVRSANRMAGFSSKGIF